MQRLLFFMAIILILASVSAKAFEPLYMQSDNRVATVFTMNEWQDNQEVNIEADVFLPPRMHPIDRFMVTLFSDIWLDTPSGMDLKTIQRGINIEAMQDMPLGRSNFSVAAGLGFKSHNLYSDHQYLYNPQEDKHDFYPIQLDYDKNKISLNYIDVPVQFRFRSRDLERTFRLYAGIRAGYLVNAHTKYEGKTYFSAPGGIQFIPDAPHDMDAVPRSTKIKEHKLENIADFRIGLTAMIGYGRVNLQFSYPLTDLFEDNSAEEMRPISLGFTFILF